MPKISCSVEASVIVEDLQDLYVAEQSEENEGGPLIMNAFEMITLSQGLNLSALFDRRQVRIFNILGLKCLKIFTREKSRKIIVFKFSAAEC